MTEPPSDPTSEFPKTLEPPEPDPLHPESDERLERVVDAAPIPVIGMLGKTGSGKSSIVRYLTGAAEAEVGRGFRPHTRTSRLFDFPDAEAPLVRFLDTRGLGESGYDPQRDLREFNESAHLILVPVRAMDRATGDVVAAVKASRAAAPQRPIVLVLTALHDGYPGSNHPQPDPFGDLHDLPVDCPAALRTAIADHRDTFDALVDEMVAVDLTRAEDGFIPPDLGGARLKVSLIEKLPQAYRQNLIQLDAVSLTYAEPHHRKVAPVILSHASLAATAAAIPMPWADIPLVLAIQSRLAYRLARLNRQKLDRQTVARVTASMGGRIAARMAVREALKVIPWFGSAVNAAMTFAVTYAAGWAWNWYFMEVSKGHVPSAAELKQVYAEQLQRGEAFWKATSDDSSD